MKEKTKKILAGIGIGLTLGTAGAFMTGCSDMSNVDMARMMEVVDNADKFMTDIASDMDNIKNSIDNLDGSNNSDFNNINQKPRTLLMRYLVNALDNFNYNYEAVINKTVKSNLPILDDRYTEVVEDLKDFKQKQYLDKDSNTLKIYQEYFDTKQYFEYTANNDGTYNRVTYNCLDGDKTIKKDNNLSVQTVSNDFKGGGFSLYNSLYFMLEREVVCESGDTIDYKLTSEGSEVFTVLHSQAGGSATLYTYYTVEFKDGLLISFVSSRANGDSEWQTIDVKYSYNVSGIEFDKTGYTEV